MDVRDLKKIVQIMNDNDLAEVEIEEEGRRLRLRKMETGAQIVAGLAPGAPVAAPAQATGPDAASTPAAAVDEGLHTITAPMVGTFYSAPAPDEDSYTNVGQRVSAESIVCILEAMKVMNEIKAECSGEIVKVCAQNGEAVEYGQALFLVKLA